ncbi:MAG: hypothetical protein ACOH1G_02820 [Flavobacterium sp.]
MREVYYLIWSDAILTAQHKNKFSEQWKILIYMFAVFQGLNFASIIILIKYLFNIQSKINFTLNILPGTILDNTIPGLITFIVPFVLINYFLIVYKDRYKKIIPNYKSHKGKFAISYIIISTAIFFIPIFILKFLTMLQS